ncbi:hypothetical protein OROGR_017919 [Orobanche gracilis]
MEEDSSSPINFAIGEVPDAAYNLQPPSLLLKPSTTIQEIRGSASLGVSSTSEKANIGTSDIDACSREVDEEPQQKRQKRTTSGVWNHFTKVDETIEENGKKTVILWAQCNKCKYKARGESTNGTKVFWNHLKKHNIMSGQQQLKVENKDNVTSVEPYKYDQEASLRKFHLAIIMHEYPFNIVEHEYFVDFIKSLRPSFPMKSRITVRKEIQEIFTQENEKLYEYFKTVKCRFSTTMDMWTSNQNKGYMCVTVHWIGEDWNIQKRIIKFMHVGGRHTGVRLSEAFVASVMRWFIEKKLFSLTLDNASANEVCVKDVISELEKICPLICDGLFFHVRCANHILNLVARDGLAAIASTTKNIHAFVVAIKSSPVQWEEFMKCASECQLDTKKGVALDVATRWNSTYLMLKDALYYKNAFQRLLVLERHRYENIAPSNEEWDKVLTLCICLKKFNDITELLSGTLYPTANLFYRNFCEIKLLLREWYVSDDITIRTMAISMTAKFDKYWKKSNVALAVTSFLDPRFKKRIIEFFMRKFHGELAYQAETEKLMRVVKQLYQQYACDASDVTRSSAIVVSHGETCEFFMEKENDELDSYLYNVQGVGATTDLEKYMVEPPLMVPKSQNFDILSWWKAHQHVYPVLSRLARDMLAMQVSTVASESAFSAGGRVIDPFRSRLDPEIVEALVCTKDWLGASKQGSQKNISSIIGDLEVLEALAANMVDQVGEEMDSDED